MISTPKSSKTVLCASYNERVRLLGLRVGYYRRRAGFTQEQLAERINVSWSSISKIESGATGVSLRMLWAIADALGISAATLLAEDGSDHAGL